MTTPVAWGGWDRWRVDADSRLLTEVVRSAAFIRIIDGTELQRYSAALAARYGIRLAADQVAEAGMGRGMRARLNMRVRGFHVFYQTKPSLTSPDLKAPA